MKKLYKVIRFAEDGFKNHPQDWLDENLRRPGCYVFFERICPMALRYDRHVLKGLHAVGVNVHARKKEVKNIGYMTGDSKILARHFDPKELVVKVFDDPLIRGVCVQAEEWPGINIDTSLKEMTVEAFMENQKRYKAFEKELKESAEDRRIAYFNTPHYFFEAIVNAADVKIS